MDMFNLNRLAYFTAVVEAGSFTGAAERLGITKTVVSQQVARLEEELRTTLFNRTTRRVELTEAGRKLYDHCVTILRQAEEITNELALAATEPMGVLRVTAPIDFGTSAVAPVAAAFCRRFPGCTVELVLSDQRIDMVANRLDLAIRVGWLQDSGHRAIRMGTFRQLLVATPEHMATLDVRTPEDLAALPFVANSALRDPLAWRFSAKDGKQRTVRFRQNISINGTPAVLAATLAGGGITILPDFLAGDLLESGQLVQVLPDWSLPSGGIHTVVPAARFRPPKVTQFVEMLRNATRGHRLGGGPPVTA